MPASVSSYNATLAGSVDARTADNISWSFLARPQSMSVYVKFQEAGTISTPGSPRVLQIGSAANAAPRFLLYASGGFYTAQYDNGITPRTSSLAVAPKNGDIVELLGTIGPTGSLQISQSVNGGSVTSGTASAATVFAPAWSATTVYVNSVGSNGPGLIALMNCVIVARLHDMGAMRRYAATKAVA